MQVPDPHHLPAVLPVWFSILLYTMHWYWTLAKVLPGVFLFIILPFRHYNAMWYYGSAINLQSIMCNEVRKCKASQIIDNRKEQVRRNPVKRLGRWRLGFKQQLLPPSRTRKKLRKNKIWQRTLLGYWTSFWDLFTTCRAPVLLYHHASEVRRVSLKPSGDICRVVTRWSASI